MSESTNDNFVRLGFELLKIKKVNGQIFSLQLKTLYAYLKGWERSSGSAFPSYSRMLDDLGIGTDKTLKKYLDQLEQLGLIIKENRSGTSNLYKTVEISKAKPQQQDKPIKQPTEFISNKTKQSKPEQPKPGPQQTPKIIEQPSRMDDDDYDPFDPLGSCVKQEQLEITKQAPQPKIYSIREPLLCPDCGEPTDQYGGCLNRNCQNGVPF